MWDIEKIRNDFPILKQPIQGHPLAYLDNAATAQKPSVVINCEKQFYTRDNASVHRGLHALAVRATTAYEHAREQVAKFIHAGHPEECVFVRGATEGINLIANVFSETHIGPGDQILVTHMEHHSNLVPWQMVAKKKQATIGSIPITQTGELDLSQIDRLLTNNTKILALTYVSNALGTINPVKTLIEKAHAKGIPVLVDAAQAAPHFQLDVQDLDCDFLVITAHKMFGPTGIGVVYAKSPWFDTLPPYQGGGSMIETVDIQHSTYTKPPAKYEAGTPAIAQAICLSKTIDYLNALDWSAIKIYEQHLLDYATEKLSAIEGLTIIGQAKHKACVISFILDNIHPHDIATILDDKGIAIRAGHHCAMPIMTFYKIAATARVSLCFYNTIEEIDRLVKALYIVKKLFNR